MPAWLLYSLTAALFYGVMNFLYKVGAERRYVNPALVLTAAATVALAAATTLAVAGTGFGRLGPAVPFALANGTLFAFGALSIIAALELAPATVVFPVNKSNVLFVILIGLIAFQETPTWSQWMGIGASLAVLALLSTEQLQRAGGPDLRGIGFALVAALCTSLSMTTGKLATTRVDRTSYILLSYLIVVLVSLVTFLKRTPPGQRRTAFFHPGVLIVGVSIGLLNYLGYRLILAAFAAGSLSLIQPVLALSILIPISLSILIYREKLTRLRVLCVGLTLISILLIQS